MSDDINIDDLVDNPTMRVPVCLCLDTSGSMEIRHGNQSRIDALNEGIKLFYEAVREDEVANYSVEIAIVKFSSGAELISDFSLAENGNPDRLDAYGTTCLGEGVNLALDLLEARKEKYKNAGVDYYQPWLVLMTDGEPNGDEDELQRAMERSYSLSKSKKLSVFPILIGDKVGEEVLQGFSPRPPMHLNGIRFKEFFEWLSKSVSVVSRSTPGEKIVLVPDEMKNWATLD